MWERCEWWADRRRVNDKALISWKKLYGDSAKQNGPTINFYCFSAHRPRSSENFGMIGHRRTTKTGEIHKNASRFVLLSANKTESAQGGCIFTWLTLPPSMSLANGLLAILILLKDGLKFWWDIMICAKFIYQRALLTKKSSTLIYFYWSTCNFVVSPSSKFGHHPVIIPVPHFPAV